MAVYCSRCNTANRDGSRFCNSCGAELSAPAPVTCPNCQAAIVAYSTYCHNCGYQLPQPPAAAVEPPPPITELDEEQGDDSAESDVISLDQVPVGTPKPSRMSTAPELAATVAAVTGTDAPAASTEQEPGDEESASASPRTLRQMTTAAPLVPLVRVRPSPSRRAPTTTADAAPLAASARPGRRWERALPLILVAAVIVGLMLPTGSLGSATPASPQVQALYDSIQALPVRSLVLVSFDYDPSTADEMNPLASAVLQQLMQRQARLLLMSLLPQGPALANAVIEPLAEQNIYSYGADYVNLGYLAGDEAALAAVSSNIASAFGGDSVRGEPIGSFAVARGVASVADTRLIVELAGDDSSVRLWVEQVQARQPVRLAAATSAVAMPLSFAYLQAGQIVGLASGWPDAAQYEYLIDVDGQATRQLGAQTMGQLAILGFIVLGNIMFVLSWRKRKA